MRSKAAAPVSSIVLGMLICPATVLTLIAGCGGGTSKTPPPPPPPPVVSVTINAPATKAIQCGTAKGLVTLTATVTGSTNTDVTWSSNNSGALDVDATTGAITPGTSCDDKTQMATITATSKADTSKTATIDMQLVDQVLVSVNGTVKIVNTDGSGATTIVPVSSGCSGPEMGSSHMKFVCQDAADTNTVYLYTTDTTASGTVPTKINVGIPVAPVASLSPDEKSIAFVSPYSPYQKVYVVDLETITSTGTDTTGAKTATATPKLIYTSPTTSIAIPWIGWLPDGSTVLVQDLTNQFLGGVPADGSTQKLTDVTSVPAWNGYFVEDLATKQIQAMYFTADGVYSAIPATATPEKISPYNLGGISPSGKRLALFAGGNVYTSDTSGNAGKVLTQGFSVSY